MSHFPGGCRRTAKIPLAVRNLPPMTNSMRHARVVFTILSFLLLTSLVGLGRYAYSRGFTSKWRSYVTKEFRARGLEISLERLTLDPFQGLVARNVLVYDAKDRQRIVAYIDQMVLQVNYANLARGKLFIDAVDLHLSNLSLPIDPARPRGQKVKISKLNARLYLPERQIYLASADARVFGIQVFATGRLINPQAFRAQSVGPAWIRSEFGKISEEIEGLRFESDPLSAWLTFSGDLEHPERLSFDLDVWGEHILRRRHEIKSLSANINCRDGSVDLRELKITDAFGELRATGAWRPEANTAELDLHSTIDAMGLLHAFHIPAGPFEDMVFYSPPSFDLRAEWSLEAPDSARVIGHFASERFAYKTVVCEQAAADFSWDGGSWSARNISLVHRTGVASGDLMRTPAEFRARLKSTVNLQDFRPILAGTFAEQFASLNFPRSPEIAIEAQGSDATPEAFVVEGQASLGPANFRGVTCDSSSATIHYEDRLLSISPFVTHPSNAGSGKLFFDFRTGAAHLD